ncbi:unnamed protein product [Dovyalis caffra]|uniref:Uncharacterized protein n=1 Tax=Dovyalis caffra TaxID=77055 RepID=A0AAV1RCF3_9ROSI|nr:unnamed protein product [Dovyalis caffra]
MRAQFIWVGYYDDAVRLGLDRELGSMLEIGKIGLKEIGQVEYWIGSMHIMAEDSSRIRIRLYKDKVRDNINIQRFLDENSLKYGEREAEMVIEIER